MTDDELEKLISPLWLATTPGAVAQRIRARLSMEVPDEIPDYVWLLVDIAAQRAWDAI